MNQLIVMNKKFYVWNDTFVRQVISLDDETVHYRDFGLETGEPFSINSECSLKHFKSKISREATEEEISRLDTEKSESNKMDFFEKIKFSSLMASSDEDLITILESRGYKVSK